MLGNGGQACKSLNLRAALATNQKVGSSTLSLILLVYSGVSARHTEISTGSRGGCGGGILVRAAESRIIWHLRTAVRDAYTLIDRAGVDQRLRALVGQS